MGKYMYTYKVWNNIKLTSEIKMMNLLIIKGARSIDNPCGGKNVISLLCIVHTHISGNGLKN